AVPAGAAAITGGNMANAPLAVFPSCPRDQPGDIRWLHGTSARRRSRIEYALARHEGRRVVVGRIRHPGELGGSCAAPQVMAEDCLVLPWRPFGRQRCRPGGLGGWPTYHRLVEAAQSGHPRSGPWLSPARWRRDGLRTRRAGG